MTPKILAKDNADSSGKSPKPMYNPIKAIIKCSILCIGSNLIPRNSEVKKPIIPMINSKTPLTLANNFADILIFR